MKNNPVESQVLKLLSQGARQNFKSWSTNGQFKITDSYSQFKITDSYSQFQITDGYSQLKLLIVTANWNNW